MALALLAAAGARFAVAADPPPPTGDPGRVSLAYADDDWVVWCGAELIEATRDMRAQSHVRTYSIQRVGEATSKPVVRTRGTFAHEVVTVLTDGTLGLTYFGSLTWARADGPEPVEYEPSMSRRLTFDGGAQHVVRGTPRGLFLQDHRVRDYQAPILFVPLEGRELRWARRIQVTRDPVSTQVPPYPLIDGDLVACGTSVVNLVTRTRRDLPPAGMGYVRALGGGWAATTMALVRLEDDRRTEYPDSRQAYHQVFAIRDGLAYAALVRGPVGNSDQGTVTLLALDVTGAAAPLELTQIKATRPSTSMALLDRGQALSFGPVELVWDRTGFWLFDGQTWKRTAWRTP